jgi:hypothetical protein
MTDNSPAVHVQPDGGAAWAPCYGSEVRLTGAGAIGCEGASLRARRTVGYSVEESDRDAAETLSALDRPDLLAEEAGSMLGFHEVALDEPRVERSVSVRGGPSIS